MNLVAWLVSLVFVKMVEWLSRLVFVCQKCVLLHDIIDITYCDGPGVAIHEAEVSL